MNILISGYGRMGRMVEQAALDRNHTIVFRADNEEDWKNAEPLSKDADVIIDFSLPEAAPGNILRAFELGIPIVCGTTGWNESLPGVIKKCDTEGKTLLVASNFSIGVNILFTVNKIMARLLGPYPAYVPRISEVHHRHKKDAPSGTAIKLAEDIIGNNSNITSWTMDANFPGNKSILIESAREGEITGMHEVRYLSGHDELTLGHNAKSRMAFAEGAVIAAEWLTGKKGFYTMADVLGLSRAWF